MGGDAPPLRDRCIEGLPQQHQQRLLSAGVSIGVAYVCCQLMSALFCFMQGFYLQALVPAGFRIGRVCHHQASLSAGSGGGGGGHVVLVVVIALLVVLHWSWWWWR